MSEKRDEINGDICAVRSAINGLWDNKLHSSHEQKSETRQLFIKFRELVHFNTDAEI